MVKLWRRDNNQLAATLSHEKEVKRLAWSADGKTLAVVAGKTLATTDPANLSASGSDDTLTLWSIESGQRQQTIPENAKAITALAFAPTGSTLAWATQSGELKLFDCERRSIIAVFKTPGFSPFACLAFTQDGKTLVTGEREITFWDIESRSSRQRLHGHRTGTLALAVSPDGRTLASAGYQGEGLKLWHIATGEELMSLPLKLRISPGGPNLLAFSPDGKLLIAGGADEHGLSTIQLWRCATNWPR
jgi:WD40 repeat protein